jgi:hypothetical protein
LRAAETETVGFVDDCNVISSISSSQKIYILGFLGGCSGMGPLLLLIVVGNYLVYLGYFSACLSMDDEGWVF